MTVIVEEDSQIIDSSYLDFDQSQHILSNKKKYCVANIDIRDSGYKCRPNHVTSTLVNGGKVGAGNGLLRDNFMKLSTNNGEQGATSSMNMSLSKSPSLNFNHLYDNTDNGYEYG